jgi:hypothetical protein
MCSATCPHLGLVRPHLGYVRRNSGSLDEFCGDFWVRALRGYKSGLD